MPALLLQGCLPQQILFSVSKVADIDLFRGGWSFWENLFPSSALTDTNFWAGTQKPSVTELSSCCVCSILHSSHPARLPTLSQLLRLMAPSSSHLLEVAEDFAHLAEGLRARLEKLLVLVVVVKMNGCR